MRLLQLLSIMSIGALTFAGVVLRPGVVRGDIFVANIDTNSIGQYTNSGATINASLITGLNHPGGIAVSGGDLFVTNYLGGTISEYTTAGVPVNTHLLSGLANPSGVAVSGSSLFVTNYEGRTISEFTLGATPGTIAASNPNFISESQYPYGIAVSGSNLFVANYDGGTIGEYTTSGAVVNAALVSGLYSPQDLTVSGTNIFVTSFNITGWIGQYTTSGATVNPALVMGMGLSYPTGIAVSGGNLFVANENFGTVSEYTTSGAVVNTALISGLHSPVGLAVTDVPEPGSLCLLLLGGGAMVACRRRGTGTSNAGKGTPEYSRQIGSRVESGSTRRRKGVKDGKGRHV